jgi:hypothetical protein
VDDDEEEEEEEEEGDEGWCEQLFLERVVLVIINM